LLAASDPITSTAGRPFRYWLEAGCGARGYEKHGKSESILTPPGGEHRQRLALPPQGYARDLQSLVAVPGRHVVQAGRTSLGDVGREPSLLISAEPGPYVALLLPHHL
jgi:hypothetical protein